MLPSPSSSPRAPLADATNTRTTTPPRPPKRTFFSSLPTPPEQTKTQRASTDPRARVRKRVKIRAKTSASDGEDSDNDLDSGDAPVICLAKRHSVYTMMTGAASGLGRYSGYGRVQLPTRSILESFVSSERYDVHRCPSFDDELRINIPYACAYSNDAKNGGDPLLAIGTEDGSVLISDTSKRSTWDPAPPKAIFRPHNNAIFDIKWSPTSNFIATASGDQTTRISCPTTKRTLHVLGGHARTVKCIMWDPTHHDLLSTGGRDGAVLLWDLRVPGADGTDNRDPVLAIPAAHEEKKRGRKGKTTPLARCVTSLLYPAGDPYGIVSSGSSDGILRYWDLRQPTRKSRSTKPHTPSALYTTATDPTALDHSLRPRGITSLALGTGPTAGLIFALGADSRIHTYTAPTLEPLTKKVYAHKNMQTNSFYVKLAVSPCGRWLASGCGGNDGSAFLFDVSGAASPGVADGAGGVELRGQQKEVGSVDWAEGELATCADDGTVRVWRPNVEVYRQCLEDEAAFRDWSWQFVDKHA